MFTFLRLQAVQYRGALPAMTSAPPSNTPHKLASTICDLPTRVTIEVGFSVQLTTWSLIPYHRAADRPGRQRRTSGYGGPRLKTSFRSGRTRLESWAAARRCSTSSRSCSPQWGVLPTYPVRSTARLPQRKSVAFFYLSADCMVSRRIRRTPLVDDPCNIWRALRSKIDLVLIHAERTKEVV